MYLKWSFRVFCVYKSPPRPSKNIHYISTKLFLVTNRIGILITNLIFCPSPRLSFRRCQHFLLFPVNARCTKDCILFLVLFSLSYKQQILSCYCSDTIGLVVVAKSIKIFIQFFKCLFLSELIIMPNFEVLKRGKIYVALSIFSCL